MADELVSVFEGTTSGLPPTKYSLDILTLANNSGEQFDIRNLLMECKIFESITSNFLLGEIAIQDATDFLGNAKIVGQETLRIRFRHHGAEHNDDIIDKIFRVYKVSGVGRAGHNTTMFKLNFCSPEFIHSKRVRISQAFVGSYADIAAKIAMDHLGLKPPAQDGANHMGGWEDADGSKLGYPKNTGPYWENIVESTDTPGQVIIPNWTVNYAINWLCSKAQGKSAGAGIEDSFFFYETANGGYKLESLSTMLKRPYLNNAEFSFSPAAAPTSNWNEAGGSGKRILAYNMGSTANVLEATIRGMFASKQTTIDNNNKNYKERIFSYLENFYGSRKEGSGSEAPNLTDISKDKHPLIWKQPDKVYNVDTPGGADNKIYSSGTLNNTVMDKTFDHSLSDFPDAHTILASQNSFVHDSKGVIKSVSEKGIEEGTIQYRTAVGQLLKYHEMNLLISSRTDIQTGQMINLVIPPTRPAAREQRDSFLHSGQYLIKEIMWDLTPTSCKTNIKVMRDSYPNDIDTYEADLSERIEEH
jgi:hypothetical protein